MLALILHQTQPHFIVTHFNGLAKYSHYLDESPQRCISARSLSLPSLVLSTVMIGKGMLSIRIIWLSGISGHRVNPLEKTPPRMTITDVHAYLNSCILNIVFNPSSALQLTLIL